MNSIIVTGDSGILGSLVVASILEKRTERVIGISRSENENIRELMSKYKDRYLHINYDLANVEGIKDLYLSHLKGLGPIYGLVNNSAYAYDDIVTNADLEQLERMYRINVFAPILLTKYAIRDMLLNTIKGSIVHISSVSAHTGYKGLSMYGSTKGAIEAFSTGIAREWGSRGIRSNCVAPGFMETNMSSSLSDEQREKIYKRTSLKTQTSANSVAESVVFLLSTAASSITGTVLHVDSGTL